MFKLESKANSILEVKENRVNPIEARMIAIGKIFPIDLASKAKLRLGMFMTVKFFEKTVKNLGLNQRGFDKKRLKLMSSEVEKR